MKHLAPFVLLSVVLSACGGSDPAPAEPDVEASQKSEDEGPPVKRAAIVKEMVSTEKYTFARLDACGKEAWVAGPVMELEDGQTVEMVGGMGMQEFRSETLNRTFEQILFVETWSISETPLVCDTPADKEPVEKDPDAPDQDFRIGTVKEVLDAAGYTYARIDVCGSDIWVAAPTTRVEVGSFGATPLGSEMTDFESTSLERTFESIWFVPWIKRSPQLPPC